MIVILVGESASGKSTLAEEVIKRDASFKKIITYTTRPIRSGEVNGESYHFVSNEEFDKLVNAGFFIEHANYRDWKYGTAIELNPEENNIIVLTPAGARAVRKTFGNKRANEIVVVYLCVDRRSRMIKLLERGDNIDESYRRNLSDVGQFDAFEKEADFTIYNNNYKYSAKELCDKLHDIIKMRSNAK